MNVKTAIKWLKELPDDFDLCFSQQTSVVMKENGEDVKYFVVQDSPIIGILKNDDTKEARFFNKIEEEYLNEQIEKGVNWRKLNE